MLAASPSFYDAITSKFTGGRWEFGVAAKVLAERFPDGYSLLDLGCGAGAFLTHLPAEAKITAVDSSTSQIDEAKRQCPSANFVCGTLEDVTGQFDAITLFHVVEHVTDPLALLRECFVRLAPNGVICFSVPLSPTIWDYGRYPDPFNLPPHHLTTWNLRALSALAVQLNMHATVDQQPCKPWLWRFQHALEYEIVGRPVWRSSNRAFISAILRHPYNSLRVAIQQFLHKTGNTAFVVLSSEKA